MIKGIVVKDRHWFIQTPLFDTIIKKYNSI